jgi:membrane protein DedA with SNARE-associated domain
VGSLEDLITRYGLAAVFFGTLLEGDVTVILAGVVAHLGMVSYPMVLVVAFAAGVLRDVTFFYLGRASPRARESRLYGHAAAAVERLSGRFGELEILVAPFLYGVRMASMIFWGVHGLSVTRFLVLDVIGCAAWVFVFSGIGYLLSDRVGDLIGDVKAVEKWLLFGLVVGILIVLALRTFTKRRQLRAEEEPPR